MIKRVIGALGAALVAVSTAGDTVVFTARDMAEASRFLEAISDLNTF